MGTPVLATRAREVNDPTDPEIRRIIADMTETLADSGGVGLAAPQVHVPLRLVIFHVPGSRAGAEGGSVPLTVLVNPVLTPVGEEMEDAWEGCLSLPGLTGLVPRYKRLRYQAVDLDGAAIDVTCEGFHARVVQHECDHLDGVLYPMRMTDMANFGFVDDIKRAMAGASSASNANASPDSTSATGDGRSDETP